ncbi:hypothetical protein AgCh_022566 [Apium graveolens]
MGSPSSTSSISPSLGWGGGGRKEGRSGGYEHYWSEVRPLLLAPMIIPIRPGVFSSLGPDSSFVLTEMAACGAVVGWEPTKQNRRGVASPRHLRCENEKGVLSNPDRWNVLDPGYVDGGDVATRPGLFKICLVLMPSSSRRGGSSSNEAPEMVPELEKWGGGKEVAAAPTSKDKKGMPALEERGD